MAELNELLKKLNQIKKDVLQPVLGDVSIDPKQIIDFTVNKTYTGRSKVGVIFQDGDGELKVVYIGAIHISKLEECIKKDKQINIKRKNVNGVPQTEITC
jgi:ABC-type transporter Mla maintaining outer membrane lipid asymmetry ATPase subunit MlaF